MDTSCNTVHVALHGLRIARIRAINPRHPAGSGTDIHGTAMLSFMMWSKIVRSPCYQPQAPAPDFLCLAITTVRPFTLGNTLSNDYRPITLQMTSGRGPAECAYAVARLLPILQAEAHELGVICEIFSTTAAPRSNPPGLLSAVVRLSGPSALTLTQQWVGTIQWIGQSPYRPTHRRKNWFISVAQVESQPEMDNSTGAIRFEAMRATGPGGQHVNKTSSAVRGTHIASGITVTAREHRSQAQNRKAAAAKIHQQIRDIGEQVQRDHEAHQWDGHQQVVRGNPTRIFRGDGFRGDKI